MCYLKFDGNDATYGLDLLAEEKNIILPYPILAPKGPLVAVKGKLTEIKMISSLAPISSAFYQSEEAYEKKRRRAKLGAFIAMFNIGPAAAGAALDRPQGPLEMCVYVSAKLDGYPIEGWIGYGQFHENDEVKVVIDKSYETHWQVYAIARPKDHVISVLPGCDQGKKAFLKFSWLFYFMLTVPIVSCLALVISFIALITTSLNEAIFVLISMFILFQFIGACTSRRPYIERRDGDIALAEKIFTALGWQDVRSISLLNMNARRIKKLKEQGDYRNWDPKRDTGTRPSPKYFEYQSGFFYYDENLDKDNVANNK